MMIEVSGAQIFSIVVLLVSGLIGFWTRRIHADLQDNERQMASLKTDIATLREQLARDNSEYAKRSEMQDLVLRIEQKIDRISDKLDKKQDKI